MNGSMLLKTKFGEVKLVLQDNVATFEVSNAPYKSASPDAVSEAKIALHYKTESRSPNEAEIKFLKTWIDTFEHEPSIDQQASEFLNRLEKQDQPPNS